MRRTAIKVIKKSAGAIGTSPETAVKAENQKFTKNAIHRIEDNIKGWIDELQVRKNDDLLQAHSFMSGF